MKRRRQWNSWKKSIDQQWHEFYRSSNWWSLSITPLSERDMVHAVANGDGALKTTTHKTDKWGIPDIYFKWKRPPGKRWCKYSQQPWPMATRNHPDFEWNQRKLKRKK